MKREVLKRKVPKERPVITIPDEVLAQLKRGITHREIDSGILCLQEYEHLLEHVNPSQENSAHLVGYFAQWVDIGFGHPSRLRELLARFPKETRARLPLDEYVDLRMAEGMLAMNDEAVSQAVAHFEVVLALGGDLSDKQRLAVANFWKARCLRKVGEYQDALVSATKASALALEL